MSGEERISNLTNVDFVASITGHEVLSCSEDNMAGAGGLNGTMKRVVYTYRTSDGKEETGSVVAKYFPTTKWAFSAQMGHPRESLFYSNFASKFGFPTPKLYYAVGDMTTGEKILVLQDLKDYVQSGYFFGPYSPHNWGRDLSVYTAKAPNVTAKHLTRLTFLTAAELHAKYWNNKELLGYPWLRSVNWYNGEGQAYWEGAQNIALNAWNNFNQKIQDGKAEAWNAELMAILGSSIKKISWDKFQEEVRTHPFTLVHGDFHPANMMYLPASESEKEKLMVLDWEQVGIGSGPQDLAQYVISHASPEDRRSFELELLREYHTALLAQNPSIVYSFDDCLKDYVYGGAERWVWLLLLLETMCPPPMVKFFHDQLVAFTKDHGVTSESIGMPRV